MVFVEDNFEGSLYLQAATDIYPSGSTFVGTSIVPVPGSLLMFAFGIISLVPFRKICG